MHGRNRSSQGTRAEIGRIVIQGQLRQGVHKISSQPVAEQGGIHLSSQAMQEADTGKIAILDPSRQKSL
jgi:hypothetical protein